MTTPRSQVVSTPKNHLTTTPNRPNASPRPNLGAHAHKSVAGKSPAVKTPASLHSRAHRISVSSHPTSTPLAASALADDMLNLNSPSAAALMASMGATGLTPLPTTQDGLGMNTGLSGLASTQDGHTGRNLKQEKYERVKDVAQMLKKRSARRGVSRSNIEALSKIHNMDSYTDEDTPETLSLMGQKYVILDVTFESSESDTVREVRLKLNDPEQGEDEVPQKEASKALTENLVNTDDSKPWHDLTSFSENLEYLNKLERTATSTSCFKIVDSLYDTFQRIWMEEKKRMKWRHDMHHLCQSNVGEPRRDLNGKLGVSSRYWTAGEEFFAKEEPKIRADASEKEDWTTSFSIEAGAPSMAASKQWLAEDALTSTVRAEDIFQESAIDKPSWQDPLSLQSKAEQPGDSMEVDDSDKKKTLAMHFVCELEPEILLSVPAAVSLNNETSQMVVLQQEQLVNWTQSVNGMGDAAATPNARWSRPQHVFSKDGKHEEKMYSYTLYAGGDTRAHPVKRLVFSHPRQFADALPVLRQYALVNTLLKSIAPMSGAEMTPPSEPASKPKFKDGKELVIRDGKELWVRSNRSKRENDLDAIMGSANSKVTSIDVRIDSSPNPARACKLQITVPITASLLSPEARTSLKAKQFFRLDIDILPNGIVEVQNIQGVELTEEKIDLLKKKLTKVIRCSEDIGTIVAWTFRELDGL